jgi:hypothetical protein
MHKYFSATGEVQRAGERVLYRPSTAGRQEVTLCVVAGDRRGARRTLRFEAS